MDVGCIALAPATIAPCRFPKQTALNSNPEPNTLPTGTWIPYPKPRTQLQPLLEP